LKKRQTFILLNCNYAKLANFEDFKTCLQGRFFVDTVYIYIFGGSCPLTEFCQVPNSLCVQVLHSPILAALLHGTQATAINQTLWHGTRNGITELLQRAPPAFDWVAITMGIGPHSSCQITLTTCYYYFHSMKFTTAFLCFNSAQLESASICFTTSAYTVSDNRHYFQ